MRGKIKYHYYKMYCQHKDEHISQPHYTFNYYFKKSENGTSHINITRANIFVHR